MIFLFDGWVRTIHSYLVTSSLARRLISVICLLINLQPSSIISAVICSEFSLPVLLTILQNTHLAMCAVNDRWRSNCLLQWWHVGGSGVGSSGFGVGWHILVCFVNARLLQKPLLHRVHTSAIYRFTFLVFKLFRGVLRTLLKMPF